MLSYSRAQENLSELGVAPGDVPGVQQLIAAVNSELRDGESEESAAKRVLETAESKLFFIESNAAYDHRSALQSSMRSPLTEITFLIALM